jgi:pimeloyl-ACP methyl ester carboxylesterase
MMERTGWTRLLSHLPGRTLHTYDRRGRGDSTDTPNFSVQAEVDELRAFLDALPGPVDVFGHSSGALLALEAALQGAHVRRLVLYEPVLPTARDPKGPAGLPEHIQALAAAGDRGGAMEAFMREGMRLAEADIERARSSERWQDQLRYAHTAAYDAAIAASYVLEPDRLANLRIPVLLLVGSDSPKWLRQGALTFAEALPGAHVGVLEDQGHHAMFSAPALLAAKIEAFLL